MFSVGLSETALEKRRIEFTFLRALQRTWASGSDAVLPKSTSCLELWTPTIEGEKGGSVVQTFRWLMAIRGQLCCVRRPDRGKLRCVSSSLAYLGSESKVLCLGSRFWPLDFKVWLWNLKHIERWKKQKCAPFKGTRQPRFCWLRARRSAICSQKVLRLQLKRSKHVCALHVHDVRRCQLGGKRDFQQFHRKLFNEFMWFRVSRWCMYAHCTLYSTS